MNADDRASLQMGTGISCRHIVRVHCSSGSAGSLPTLDGVLPSFPDVRVTPGVNRYIPLHGACCIRAYVLDW